MMIILPVCLQVWLKQTPPTVCFFCWECYPWYNTRMFWNRGWGTLFQLPWTKIVFPKYECPVTICTAGTIGTVKSRQPLRVLFDSGSTVSMIKRSALPQQVVTKLISETKTITMLAGKVQGQEVVTLRDLMLQEFDKNWHISQQKAMVFDNDKVK